MEQETLNAHNAARAQEGKPPLEWCNTCAAQAQAWANQLASTGQFEHPRGLCSSNHPMGQNLAMGGKNMTPTKAVNLWMQEKVSYRASGIENAGHYTQVVWKSTTHVGVGVARNGNKTVVVANYHPPGNWQGQFRNNV
jgi:uncharacterized protein YkwD